MSEHQLSLLSGAPSDISLGVERFPHGLRDYVRDYDERVVSLDALIGIIDECKHRFSNDSGDILDQTEADKWLAPRLHASLRLSKREATNPEVWAYLAAYVFPDYVVWRWGRERQSALSFTQDVKKHPFKRLWWGAEMFRNGSDYSAVSRAFARSDVANTSLSTKVMNNRAVALGVLRFLDEYGLGSRKVNPVSTQLRTSAVTVALDSACPNVSESFELDEDWLRVEPLAEDIIREPVGPQHGAVLEGEIKNAEAMLKRVIDINAVNRYRQRGREDAA